MIVYIMASFIAGIGAVFAFFGYYMGGTSGQDGTIGAAFALALGLALIASAIVAAAGKAFFFG